MQIVIDIPEEAYEYWKNHSYEYVLAEAIRNGTPLPKGHGRLIDADELKKQSIDMSQDAYDRCMGVWVEDIDEAPTIIDADKESD